MIKIRNPHSILALLDNRPKAAKQLYLPNKAKGYWAEVASKAASVGVDTLVGKGDGAFLIAEPVGAMSLNDLDPGHGHVVVLDQVQDPQNVGSIFRAAGFFGIQACVLTDDRSAGLTDVVYDVASGGVEYVPLIKAGNLSNALDLLKEKGFWVLGTSEHADEDLRAQKNDRAWAIIFGNEENGIRPLTLKKCDVVCNIKGLGKVDSLNVSVAAGIALSHLSTSS